MTVGGGGETTVAEVDDLEITSCGIGDFAFLTPYLNQLEVSSGLMMDMWVGNGLKGDGRDDHGGRMKFNLRWRSRLSTLSNAFRQLAISVDLAVLKT
jgi:hypothetical protein